MKRESKLLLDKAISSLIISIEHFNKPSDIGRTQAVLIFLDHSFEMLLKASLIERNNKIREKGDKNTIGFESCIRRGLTGINRFLDENQVFSLQIINGYRDAAQHYLLDISEQILYITIQTGLSLFRTILKDVFDKQLIDYFPERVLPVSTIPLVDISVLFDEEVQAIKSLLKPGKRKRTEALSRLRQLAIMDQSLSGQNQTPSDEELEKIGKDLSSGKEWYDVFSSVASMNITSSGYGPSLELKIDKKEGVPILFVPEGTPHSGVVAIKRVNELDFYSLNLTQLHEKFESNLTKYQLQAIIWYLDLQSNLEYFKVFRMGKAEHKRYSQKAITIISNSLPQLDLENILIEYKNRNPKK